MNEINTRWTRRQAILGLAGLGAATALYECGLVPAAAARQAPQELTTQQLADGLTVVMGDGGNVAVLAGPEGLLVVDTGLKPQADDLIKSIHGIKESPVKLVVNTHWHFDHVGGNEAFGKTGVPILAHTNTRKRLSTDQTVEFLEMKAPAMPKAAVPVRVFDKELKLNWGAEKIHLLHIADAHTDTDILLHFTKSNVLHTGDLLFNGLYPFIDYSSRGWIGGMVRAADRILAMTDSQTKIIPGHGPIATRDDVKSFRDMLASIQANVEKLIKEGKSADEAVAAKPTAEFDEKWGKGFLPPDRFAKLVYLTITRHRA